MMRPLIGIVATWAGRSHELGLARKRDLAALVVTEAITAGRRGSAPMAEIAIMVMDLNLLGCVVKHNAPAGEEGVARHRAAMRGLRMPDRDVSLVHLRQNRLAIVWRIFNHHAVIALQREFIQFLRRLFRMLGRQPVKDSMMVDLPAMGAGVIEEWTGIGINIFQRRPDPEKVVVRPGCKMRNIPVNRLQCSELEGEV